MNLLDMRYCAKAIRSGIKLTQLSMPTYNKIVIVHPGAIGDAVMGTPVALMLKANFPESHIVYLAHASLFPIIELCGAIDTFEPWNRHVPFLELVAAARKHRPDLIVDLVGSLKTRLVCLLSGARVLTYPKQRNPSNWQHVVDNYLATLKPLNLKQVRAPLFPTLTPPQGLICELRADAELKGNLIALVPGVGKHRPNRAWPPELFAQLGDRLADTYNATLVLVGGADDEVACHQVMQHLGDKAVNFAGRLSLPQTTALLSQVEIVVSADTGPAHIAAAVGKPVVCLMGPTQPERTGPYAMESIGIYVGQDCHCQGAKRCLVQGCENAGQCMQTITVEAVMDKVKHVMSLGQSSLSRT